MFGTPSRRGARVRADDTLFIWQAQVGLIAYAVVTGDAEPAGEGAFVPWPEPDRYRYLWPIEIVVETETPLAVRWKDLNDLAGLRGVPASQLPPMDESRVGRVRDLFAEELSRPPSDPSQRLVQAWATDRQLAELRRIDSDFDARVSQQKAIKLRQGQGRFRKAVLDAYDSRCCVTGFTAPPALEAAHIAPYRGEHTNRVWNGLLLRADVHTLFDLHLLTVLPDGTVRAGPDLNSTSYAELAGRRIRFPKKAVDRPAPQVLAEHNGRCSWL